MNKQRMLETVYNTMREVLFYDYDFLEIDTELKTLRKEDKNEYRNALKNMVAFIHQSDVLIALYDLENYKQSINSKWNHIEQGYKTEFKLNIIVFKKILSEENSDIAFDF